MARKGGDNGVFPIVRHSNEAVVLEYRAQGTWRESLLLCADQHIDSADCDRRLLRKHLDEARAGGHRALFLGDLYDIMQSTHDKRRSYSALKELHKDDAYLNSVLDDAVEFLSPYAGVIAMIGYGNHETAVRKHQSIDLVDLTVQRLNNLTGSKILKGSYSGWVMLRGKARESSTSPHGATLRRNLYYHHGSGGSSPVTRGVIKTARRAVDVPDADIVVAGHIHQSWALEVPRHRLTTMGVTYQDTQWHLQLGTYKRPNMSQGWEVEKELSPPVLGGWWLDLSRTKERTVTRAGNNSWRMVVSPRRAQ